MPEIATTYHSFATPSILFIRPREGNGFTLLEILVALSILALLGMLGYRSLVNTTEHAAHLKAASAYWQNLDAFFNRLADDLRQAMQATSIRSTSSPTARAVEPTMVWREDHDAQGALQAIYFIRAGQTLSLPEQNLYVPPQTVGYQLRPNGATYQLYYLRWPHSTANGALAQSPDTPLERYLVVDNLIQWNVTYFDAYGRSLTRWDSPHELPVALEITLIIGNPGGNGNAISRKFTVL